MNGFKISGSAYKLNLGKLDGSGRKTLHHGTLLIDVNKDTLSSYLTPNRLKLLSKGVESVWSRVTNLRDLNSKIDHASWCDELEIQF